MANYIENIPDTLCIQLSTSDIKRIGLLDLLTTVSKSCQYHIIYIIDLTP